MRLSSERGSALLLLAIATAVSVGTATDPDLWWHLRTGEVIVNDGLPRADLFSFTVPGSDWITHEWGAQVLMWELWRIGGSTALIVTFTLMVGAALVMAYATSRARPVITASVALLAGLAAHVATAPRPQMFNLVLLAALGLVRLPDLYTRMHASTKPATLGVSLVVSALALHAGELGIGIRALLIVLFFLLTAPVAAHRLAHAAYRVGVPRWAGTVRDDLRDAQQAELAQDASFALIVRSKHSLEGPAPTPPILCLVGRALDPEIEPRRGPPEDVATRAKRSWITEYREQ